MSITEQWPGLFYDKGGAVLNVKHPDFGAIGDGITDDTAAIQAAINSLDYIGGVRGAGILGEGGIIYFPQGIYKITSPLTITATSNQQNISFIGSGPLVSVIDNTATDGGNAITITGVPGNSVHALLLRDISVHGNSSSGAGIYCERVIRQVEFDRVDIFNHGGDGITFIDTSNIIVLRSCRIRDNDVGIRSSLNGEQVWMYGNSIRGNRVGIAIGSFINIFNIYGGDITTHSDSGVSFFGGSGEDAMVTSVEIRGVYFEGNAQDIVMDNIGSTNFTANILIAANSFSQTSPTSGNSRCIDIKRGQYIAIEHNEFRKITSSNIDACINIGSEAEDVYIGPNWFPASTTRTKINVDGSATRIWGYIRPDTNAAEFNAWGTIVAGTGFALGSPIAATVSSGQLDLTSGTIVVVAAESGTTDDLNYIQIPDEAGRMLILKADIGDTITIKDNVGSDPSGYNSIQCAGDFAMDENDHMTLYWDDTEESGKWKELSRSSN